MYYFKFSGIGNEEDEKENRETSSIKTGFITKEREALSANDTNTSADISGINSFDTSKADNTKESERSKLKVSFFFIGRFLILIYFRILTIVIIYSFLF